MRTMLRLRLVFPLLVLLLLAAGIAYYASASAPGEASKADAVALAYSHRQMVWVSPPQVQRTLLLRLRQLPAVLRRDVPSSVATNVNVPDLERTFGPRRRVALVILSGVYNSLPPDEGVNLRGSVVVLVDAATNRALYLMD